VEQNDGVAGVRRPPFLVALAGQRRCRTLDLDPRRRPTPRSSEPSSDHGRRRPQPDGRRRAAAADDEERRGPWLPGVRCASERRTRVGCRARMRGRARSTVREPLRMRAGDAAGHCRAHGASTRGDVRARTGCANAARGAQKARGA